MGHARPGSRGSFLREATERSKNGRKGKVSHIPNSADIFLNAPMLWFFALQRHMAIDGGL